FRKQRPFSPEKKTRNGQRHLSPKKNRNRQRHLAPKKKKRKRPGPFSPQENSRSRQRHLTSKKKSRSRQRHLPPSEAPGAPCVHSTGGGPQGRRKVFIFSYERTWTQTLREGNSDICSRQRLLPS